MTKKIAKANPLQAAPKPSARPKTNAQRQIAPADKPKVYSPRGHKKGKSGK